MSNNFLQIVYELFCLSVNNDTISKIRWKLICPTIEVEAYLKQEGRAMNITILPDDWLETCNDVKWLRVNLAYLYISTDFSIYLWDLVRAFLHCSYAFQHVVSPKCGFCSNDKINQRSLEFWLWSDLDIQRYRRDKDEIDKSRISLKLITCSLHHDRQSRS